MVGYGAHSLLMTAFIVCACVNHAACKSSTEIVQRLPIDDSDGDFETMIQNMHAFDEPHDVVFDGPFDGPYEGPFAEPFDGVFDESLGEPIAWSKFDQPEDLEDSFPDMPVEGTIRWPKADEKEDGQISHFDASFEGSPSEILNEDVQGSFMEMPDHQQRYSGAFVAGAALAVVGVLLGTMAWYQHRQSSELSLSLLLEEVDCELAVRGAAAQSDKSVTKSDNAVIAQEQEHISSQEEEVSFERLD